MKWTIKTRLITGCVVLLVVIAIACSYGLQQMSSAEHSISDITRRSDVNIKRLGAAHDAKEGLLKAHQNETEFRLTKLTKDVEEALQGLKESRASLHEITADGTAGDSLNGLVIAALASSAWPSGRESSNSMALAASDRCLKNASEYASQPDSPIQP